MKTPFLIQFKTPATLFGLFKLVNFVAEKTITEPKELSEFYDEVIPKSAKEAIKKGDKEK